MAAIRPPIGEHAADLQRIGSVPQVALTAAFGLLILACSYTAGRFSLPFATILYWAGIGSIVVPAAWQLMKSRSRRRDLLCLATVGLALYGAKVLQAPGMFTQFDEFHHWATLNDIVSTNHLFERNNILPASPYYPGLEVLTAALVSSGLPVWIAATIVLGAARLLLVLSLYLFMERAAGSSRVAAISTLVYMANPSFLIFDAQFSYESLALPLALFAMFCLIRRTEGSRRDSAALTMAFILGVIGIVVTHHITSIALAGFLGIWAASAYLMRRLSESPAESKPGLLGPAIVAMAATVGWILYVATVTVGYLAPAFQGALQQVLSLVLGAESSRELFRAATGEIAPTWELLIGFGSVGLILACLPAGLVIFWRAKRRSYTGLALGLVALAYPATLIPRFTARGAELSARTVAFTFVGIGFVLALFVISALRSDRRILSRLGRPAALAGLTLLFAGGVIVGVAPWARLPGPYRVAADARSVETLGITVAEWTLANLGPDNRFMSDRTNRILLATYGGQHAISTVGDRVDLKDAYFAEQITPAVLHDMSVGDVKFVIADLRLPQALPTVGVYVDRGEVIGGPGWTRPMPRAALEKWDLSPRVSRIYDAGNIRIYDVRALVDAAR